MDRLQHLEALRSALASVRPGLHMPSSDAAEALRKRALRRLDDHVLPRVTSLDAPLVAVVGGPTGSGKSTVVNSLVGQRIAETTALRPTTRVPLLVHAPEQRSWFDTTRILPRLARIVDDTAAGVASSEGNPAREIRIQQAAIPAGLALLDAPDIDSVSVDNRTLARELLDAADAWLFVTTATRYADAVPWELLKQAAARSMELVVVLNRVPPGATATVVNDLTQMLVEAGLGATPIFTCEEQNLDDGLLPVRTVAELKSWLLGLTDNSQTHEQVARRALAGSVADVVAESTQVVAGLEQENLDIERSAAQIEALIDQGVQHIHQATADGTLLRGEVLARWQEVVGSGDFTRALARTVTSARDRLDALVWRKPAPVQSVADALEAGLSHIVRAELLNISDQIERIWALDPSTRDLTVPVADIRQATKLAEELTREWQRDVLAMVRSQGATRRTSARIAAFGINVVGVALMVVIFAQTGGLTGAEVGVVGASAALAQSALEAIFGDQAVRMMTRTAHEVLEQRAREALEKHVQPIKDLLPVVHTTKDLELVLKAVRADWGVR